MTEMTLEMNRELPSKTGQIRGWLEVVCIFLLFPVGGILGGLTGFLPLAAICSVLVPLVAATLFLRREGTRWRSLVFGRQLPASRVAAYGALAIVGAVFALLITTAILRAAGLPPPDISAFTSTVEGNLTLYLWLLIPVSWGSAAVGEELLTRGFLLHRLEGLAGTSAAVVLQAFIFAVVHFYQGITGVASIFALALVFGAVYVKCGRSLLPLILAHGLIDTYAMTVIYLGRADLLLG